MLLQLLAFWHRFTLSWALWVEAGKQRIRSWVGAAPIQYALLQDGRVVPASMSLPPVIAATAYLYDPPTHRISSFQNPDLTARYRRLPYLAGVLQHPSIGDIDFSDWLGEIRAHPVPELPPRQILTLWSLVHNRYIPLSDGASVTITKNDGETEFVVFE